jgi:hypothetical protein
VICAFVFLLDNRSYYYYSSHHHFFPLSKYFSLRARTLKRSDSNKRNNKYALNKNVFYYLLVNYQILELRELHVGVERITQLF